MGLFDKLKNVFMEDDIDDYEEPTSFNKQVEKEEPSKNEPIIREIEKKEEPVSDREMFETEDNFKFPIVFEDEDFEEEKRTRSINVLEKENTKYEKREKYEKFDIEKDIKSQKFKPSPIISPVYGVLDKNYTKSDITVNEGRNERRSIDDIDSVMQRAYGGPVTRENKNKKVKEKRETIEQQIEEIKEVEELAINNKMERLDEKIKSIDDLLNETTDEDFYSLVDSMYQDKED